MKTILSLLCCCAIFAEDAPKQLDPHTPADAVQIIDALTQRLQLPRNEAIALTIAIETLRKLATPPPAPVLVKD